MKIHFFTLALDAMPFITHHWPVFRSLSCAWDWTICHGVAAPVNCTQWCKPIAPRLSLDGTAAVLESLSNCDARVRLISKPLWDGGKVEMCNAALKTFDSEGLLWQVDSDELWTAEQIERMRRMFMAFPEKASAEFLCRYFFGRNIVTTGMDCYGNNRSYEWRRVWRFKPGMRFSKHEPPVLDGCADGQIFTHDDTLAAGLVFDHMAYATEPQVRFKEEYYGYKGAAEQWGNLQRNTVWPVKRLKDFLPWVDDRAGADLIVPSKS